MSPGAITSGCIALKVWLLHSATIRGVPWLCCTALGCAVLPCLRRVTLAVLQCRGAELRVLLDLGMWATSSTPDLALCRDSVLCVASGSPLSAAPLCGCRQLSWAPDAAAVCCVCAHVFACARWKIGA